MTRCRRRPVELNTEGRWAFFGQLDFPANTTDPTGTMLDIPLSVRVDLEAGSAQREQGVCDAMERYAPSW